MIRIGQHPYIECSSRGDKRFSAFYARPACLNGQSIEEAYQAFKQFEDGTTGLTWQQAKGRKAVNQSACLTMYRRWWTAYVAEKKLLPILKAATGLSDMFGQVGHVCQATVLWEIRNA